MVGLIQRLQNEADLCRNDGASDIAALLDEAVKALQVAAAPHPPIAPDALRAAAEKARAALSDLLLKRDPIVYSDALRALDEALAQTPQPADARGVAALDYVLACAAGDEPIAQPQSAADALLPCPFCGGAGAVIDR